MRERIRHWREIRFNNDRIRYNERQKFIWQTFDFIKESHVTGSYFEFGCHKAITFRMALAEAHRRGIDWMDFYAFDSFEGLPSTSPIDYFPQWKAGALATSEERFLDLVRRQGKLADKVRTVKGFYKDTLTPRFRDSFVAEGRKIAIAFVDCDLYESTVQVLDFIDPLLQKGSVIYFDDYYLFAGDPGRGEQRAFAEYQNRTTHRFNPHLQVGWFGRSFIVY